MDTTINPTPGTEETNEQGATQAATNGKAAAEPKPKKALAQKKAPKTAAPKATAKSGTLTMQELAERYLAKLEAEGRSGGTIFSYRLEIRLALAALGEKTNVAKLTRPKVQAFLESDAVTKTRTGLPKSPLSVAKTIRVLRQCLAHGVELGVIEKAPMPE